MLANNTIFKKGLLLITLVALFAPLLQSNFKFLNLYKLAGDDGPLKDTTFTVDTYFSGVYQSKMDKHIASDFGFRSLLIKTNNQLYFSLFDKANAKEVVIGKENYLFESSYIDAYLGNDFIGEDSINRNLNRLKLISDKLSKRNKQLIIVIAPSKPSFYSEYLPSDIGLVNNKTNYSVMIKAIKNRQLHCIDFNDWFIKLKKTSKYPLYPKHGNHWSNYGAYLASDSIIRYIEQLQHIDMPDLIIKKINIEQPKNEDNDIGYGINLLCKLKSFDLAYPEVTINDNPSKTKPNILVIGDSFYWNLYNLGFSKCFQSHSFWYYNKIVFPADEESKLVNDLNRTTEYHKKDIIIILATELNLKRLGWGFIENAEKYLD